MLPQWVRGYIRRPHKLGGRGLVRLHKRRRLRRTVMTAPYPQVKSGAYGAITALKPAEHLLRVTPAQPIGLAA